MCDCGSEADPFPIEAIKAGGYRATAYTSFSISFTISLPISFPTNWSCPRGALSARVVRYPGRTDDPRL